MVPYALLRLAAWLALFATTALNASGTSANSTSASNNASSQVSNTVSSTLLAETRSASNDQSQLIVVMGDSISAAYGIQREQGWVHLLDQRLRTEEAAWQVANASVSGETTGGGLARLPGVLDELHPQLVIIELGGNDGLRGYPVAKIRSNLTRMVELVRGAGAVPVIAAMRIPPNYGPRYTRAFDGVFAEVASATDTALIPFLLEDVALQPGMMQNDGIHPTAVAQPLLVQAVLTTLAPLLSQELSPDTPSIPRNAGSGGLP